MKLSDIFESINPSIRETLLKDCSQFITSKNGIDVNEVYRGFRSPEHFSIKRFNTNSNRLPKDTTPFVYSLMDETTKVLTGHRFFSTNTAFATSERENAAMYGRPYLFFPIGNFSYLYFNNEYDVMELQHTVLNSCIQTLTSHRSIPGVDKLINIFSAAKSNKQHEMSLLNTNLPDTISSCVPSDKVQNISSLILNAASSSIKSKMHYNSGLIEAIKSEVEIMFNCSSYYLVDPAAL